ncbi:hypothetical protein NMY22_g11576 [Coprinellus aureogranulatus]|nr:hypothetical protein NMY22_g11576 [Coprinellus aureogranulatus]
MELLSRLPILFHQHDAKETFCYKRRVKSQSYERSLNARRRMPTVVRAHQYQDASRQRVTHPSFIPFPHHLLPTHLPRRISRFLLGADGARASLKRFRIIATPWRSLFLEPAFTNSPILNTRPSSLNAQASAHYDAIQHTFLVLRPELEAATEIFLRISGRFSVAFVPLRHVQVLRGAMAYLQLDPESQPEAVKHQDEDDGQKSKKRKIAGMNLFLATLSRHHFLGLLSTLGVTTVTLYSESFPLVCHRSQRRLPCLSTVPLPSRFRPSSPVLVLASVQFRPKVASEPARALRAAARPLRVLSHGAHSPAMLPSISVTVDNCYSRIPVLRTLFFVLLPGFVKLPGSQTLISSF